MRVTILGCGGSSGTPAIDWGWGRCNPDNPRNRRLRPSILVENGDTTILVDTSPDLRQQLLGVGVRHLDAVLFTHYHADHLNGIDDLRPINRAMNAPLDAYADADTIEMIGERFGYVFDTLSEDATHFYKPTLIPHELNGRDRVVVGDVTIDAIDQDHGFCRSLGFRFGPIAYTTDVVELPEYAFDLLAGIEVWIVGVLTDRPHPTHAHVGKALDWMARIGPRRGVLTHLSTFFDYDALAGQLPRHVEPAHDGMVIEA